MDVTIKKLPKSTVEIEGEISAEDFGRHHKDALKELNEKSSIPGFRAGHIPENILIEKIGEGSVLEHAAEHALKEAYPKIIKENGIDAIGHPQITITKIARNNPLGFKITTAILPHIELPDYKNMASFVINRKEEIKVEEKEIDEAIEYLKKTSEKSAEKEKEDLPVENKEQNPTKIDDEFAKKFGQKDIVGLREQLRENIRADKTARGKEKKRMEALDKISASTNIEIPDILIQSEKEKMAAELRSSLENMGMKWDDYLKHIKKSGEELKNGWSKEAENRARYAIILRKIAETENIEPSDEELENFVKNAVAQYPESERQKIDKTRAKEYAYGIIRNEKVFRLLESEKNE